MKSVKYILIIVTLISLFGRCSSVEEPQKVDTVPLVSEQEIPGPFHFQKDIEVKPGLIFDILNWGRGADSISAYLILRSDSLHKKFNSTSGELEGNIVDVWNMDMDSDGNPEIFIQTKDKKDNLNLYIHEFDNSGTSQKLHFPDLSEATKKIYRGKDSIYVKDDKLMREFPIYKNDSTEKAEGKKTLIYSLSKNDFSVVDPNAKPEPEKPKKKVKKKRSGRRR
ncbi:MAG TPA: hypothetical protein DIT07_01205 [Sphingobacteriaceae bacterium]|nr:hypothetical protein [Sphingobacteriaceae bacterium]